MAYRITDKCAKCGSCEPMCPVGAISFNGEKYVIDKKQCASCGMCANVCPVGAPEPDEN